MTNKNQKLFLKEHNIHQNYQIMINQQNVMIKSQILKEINLKCILLIIIIIQVERIHNKKLDSLLREIKRQKKLLKNKSIKFRVESIKKQILKYRKIVIKSIN